MEPRPADEAGRACGRRLAEQDVAAVGMAFLSTELLEALAHLAWVRDQQQQGDAKAFVRAFVDAYRTYRR